MKTRIWTVVVGITLLMACSRNPAPETRWTPRGEGNERQIAAVEMFNSIWDWQRTPWARLDDMTAPIYVLLDQQRHACLVDGATWAIAQRGEFWPCPAGWRFPRP